MAASATETKLGAVGPARAGWLATRLMRSSKLSRRMSVVPTLLGTPGSGPEPDERARCAGELRASGGRDAVAVPMMFAGSHAEVTVETTSVIR